MAWANSYFIRIDKQVEGVVFNIPQNAKNLAAELQKIRNCEKGYSFGNF